MDVDTYPSPASLRTFRPLTMSSGKRPRSPDADTFSGDHPSKRLFRLSGTDPVERSRSPSSSYGMPSASGSRYPSEDWVAQAGGLSIDSPMFHTSRSANSSYENLHRPIDVDVAMDTDTEEHPSLQKPIHTSESASSPSSMPVSRSMESSQTTVATSSTLSRQVPLHHPQINIHPATPTSSLSSAAPSRTNSHSSTPEPGPIPMVLSPAQSFSQLLNTPRRPRFTMGFRADCDKCRMGVKGHWMHLD